MTDAHTTPESYAAQVDAELAQIKAELAELRELRTWIEGLIETAKTSPMFKQVLSMLGIKLP